MVFPATKWCIFACSSPSPSWLSWAFLAFDRYTDSVRSTLLFSGITLLVGFLLAWGTEWGQAHLTDYRSGDPLDLLADGTALVLSTLLVIFLDIRKQKKHV